jgi:hypothetical protein
LQLTESVARHWLPPLPHQMSTPIRGSGSAADRADQPLLQGSGRSASLPSQYAGSRRTVRRPGRPPRQLLMPSTSIRASSHRAAEMEGTAYALYGVHAFGPPVAARHPAVPAVGMEVDGAVSISHSTGRRISKFVGSSGDESGGWPANAVRRGAQTQAADAGAEVAGTHVTSWRQACAAWWPRVAPDDPHHHQADVRWGPVPTHHDGPHPAATSRPGMVCLFRGLR